jgi:hypothetical protein
MSKFPNFELHEFIDPKDDTPTFEQIENLISLITFVIQPARTWLKVPFKINSGIRSVKKNKAIGGAVNSQHCRGEACDIDLESKELNKKLFFCIKENLPFDQLLNEKDYSWIHVSYKSKGNRKQVLVIP